jgi:hypothetical protein
MDGLEPGGFELYGKLPDEKQSFLRTADSGMRCLSHRNVLSWSGADFRRRICEEIG